jgi:hypothetical protein
MNGYLNNLAMRSMDLGNRVEPRLPSLFEAGAVNAGAVNVRPAPKTDAPEAYEEDVTVESAAASGRLKSSPGSDQVSTAVAPEATRRVEHSHTQQPLKAEDAAPGEAAPPVTSSHDHVESATVESLTLSVPEETSETVAPPQTKPAATSRPSDASDLPSEIHEERVVQAKVPADIAPSSSQSQTETRIDLELDQATTLLNVQSAKPARPTTPLAPRTTAPIKPKSNEEAAPTGGPIEIEPDVEESENSSGLPRDTRIIQELDPTVALPQQVTTTPWRETRSQPAHWRRRQSPGPTEPEPSINVTIGRLEIRAVPADNRKTSAARRSESPVMPLDEYLRKQRRGAER